MIVEWSDRAREDFDAAMAFIEERSPAAADRIAERIFRVVALLENFPRIAPRSRHRGLRQLVVRRTPYLVIYRIRRDRVEIHALVHARQRRRR